MDFLLVISSKLKSSLTGERSSAVGRTKDAKWSLNLLLVSLIPLIVMTQQPKRPRCDFFDNYVNTVPKGVFIYHSVIYCREPCGVATRMGKTAAIDKGI